jgi:carbamoyl-phosphate synthase large subunit
MSALRIAVSGLHRGENPQPGAGIIRSLRRQFPDAYIAGLIYDAMESGIYVEDGPDAIFPMPYPTSGAEAFLQRLDMMLAQSPVDIFIPTVDSEIELLVHLGDELGKRGLRTCLPEKAALARRAKTRLEALANACHVIIPETVSVHSIAGAAWAARKLGYPLMVKGQYYDAKYVENEMELASAVSKLLAEWGAPAMLQRCIHGPEFNALGLGDGEGGIVGLCCIRKTIVSDKGKGLGGMTISDKRLTEMCARLIRELRWRGPFEIEVIRDEARGEYALIEINPRFPAWIDFPSMIGVNFPVALVEMITAGCHTPLPECAAGHFYLRHQVEVHGHIDQLAALSTSADFAAQN